MVSGVVETLQVLLEYIVNPGLLPSPYYDIWWWGRAVFLFVTLLLVGGIIFLFSVNDYLKYRFKENYSEYMKGKPHQPVKIEKDWKEIAKQAKDENEAERKMAVIEADDVINEVLGKLGYEGEDLLEKLDGLNKEIIPNIEEVREAHRKRRDIVYDPNTALSKEEAVEIISVYEEIFEDLQVL